ncbi:hypothetical protein CYMTET_15633 [Cymbomonas tetramitiformis]|uniref:Uncharacterized protein n=1 Tax=Cymbomonas tetramitiformis TaxID=36881 RepID=A0AAE0GE25_9CHLO|nr:hypothetical protein CYMTET_15633 [Cymbomonas tetramitiformis]
MGVRGLTSLVKEHSKAELWNCCVEGQRDLVLVDASALKFCAAASVEQCQLHLREGLYSRIAVLIRDFLETFLREGLRVWLFLDGSIPDEHEETVLSRREHLCEVVSKVAGTPRAPCSELLRGILMADQNRGLSLPIGPLAEAAMLGEIAQLKAKYAARLEVTRALHDADRALCQGYYQNVSKVAAVITNDSDFFVFGLERIVLLGEKVMFQNTPENKRYLKLWSAERAWEGIRAFFALSVETSRKTGKPDLQVPSLRRHISPATRADIAVIMGTDRSDLCRKAIDAPDSEGNLKTFGVRLVVRRLLSALASQKGWIDSQERATKKLFKDLGLSRVANRWDVYTQAREEFSLDNLPGASSFLPVDCLPMSSRLARRLVDWEAWPGLDVLYQWAVNGLGFFSLLGSDLHTYDALRRLRAAVLQRMELPPGWVVHELAFTGSSPKGLALLLRNPPASYEKGKWVGVHPCCYNPGAPPFETAIGVTLASCAPQEETDRLDVHCGAALEEEEGPEKKDEDTPDDWEKEDDEDLLVRLPSFSRVVVEPAKVGETPSKGLEEFLVDEGLLPLSWRSEEASGISRVITLAEGVLHHIGGAPPPSSMYLVVAHLLTAAAVVEDADFLRAIDFPCFLVALEGHIAVKYQDNGLV